MPWKDGSSCRNHTSTGMICGNRWATIWPLFVMGKQTLQCYSSLVNKAASQSEKCTNQCSSYSNVFWKQFLINHCVSELDVYLLSFDRIFQHVWNVHYHLLQTVFFLSPLLYTRNCVLSDEPLSGSVPQHCHTGELTVQVQVQVCCCLSGTWDNRRLQSQYWYFNHLVELSWLTWYQAVNCLLFIFWSE